MFFNQKKWELEPQDPVRALELAEILNTSPLVAQILINRGLGDEEKTRRFLDCHLRNLADPFLLGDMETAAKRIISALGREKILIYGDYDVDGVTATALLVLFLRDLGFSAYYYIPNRVREEIGRATV